MPSVGSLSLILLSAALFRYVDDDSPPPAPLAAPAAAASDAASTERARMDFLLGSWRIDAKIRASNGYLEGSGSMHVRRADDGTTLLADMETVFNGFTVKGITRRAYNPVHELWEVDWLTNNEVTSVRGIEGRFADGRFIEINYGTDALGAYIGRLVLFDLSEDRFSVRKDRLYDDGTVHPEIWVYEATRSDDTPSR